MEFKIFAIVCASFLVLMGTVVDCQPSSIRYAHVCRDQLCKKVARDDVKPDETPMAIGVCKFSCNTNESNLWPLPTGQITIGKSMTMIYPSNITHVVTESPAEVHDWLNKIFPLFLHKLYWMHPNTDDHDHEADPADPFVGTPNSVNTMVVQFKIASAITELSIGVDESYSLNITKDAANNLVTAVISAQTYFGARHGLETLSQLVAYDDYDKSVGCLQVLDNVLIVNDKPTYSYRGVMLDTTRNFMPIKRLERFIDGLSFGKLNIFHWHITDTHSYPMQTLEQPEMHEYGPYSPSKVYSVQQMKELKEYAKIRGVKIVAEFDAPAHVGNGWQWGPKLNLGDLAVCVNQEPWYDYCVEPPCGQLNLANENIYTVLDKVYKNYMDIFDNDIFHMGGDEVDLRCYNSTKAITDLMAEKGIETNVEGFVQIWDEFQTKARNLVLKHSTNAAMKIILWTATITDQEYIKKYINESDYIIQIWTESNNDIIPFLLDNGYKTIFSNVDALYLDCGYQAWIGNGHNWCSPYKGWQTIYDNNPIEIYAKSVGTEKAETAMRNGQILGEITPLWAEQSDQNSMESKVFPRASALAERLWTNPKTTWLEAERRMVNNRKRLVERGIRADRLQPEWCYQNENECPGPPAPEPPQPTPNPNGINKGPVSSILITLFALSVAFSYTKQ